MDAPSSRLEVLRIRMRGRPTAWRSCRLNQMQRACQGLQARTGRPRLSAGSVWSAGRGSRPSWTLAGTEFLLLAVCRGESLGVVCVDLSTGCTRENEEFRGEACCPEATQVQACADTASQF